jgi:hypothetical protein
MSFTRKKVPEALHCWRVGSNKPGLPFILPEFVVTEFKHTEEKDKTQKEQSVAVFL